jgi:hypothetical protein
MKKECAHTRKALPRYLHGHLFKLEQVRIERHLRSCVVCYSQYESLKRVAETRKFLKDITPPEGVVQIVKEGMSGLSKFKKLLYRPLWILAILMVGVAAYYFLSKPRPLDVEIDDIVKTAPSKTAISQTGSVQPPAVNPPVPAAVRAASPATAREMDPLVVTITTEDGKAAMRRINEVMRGHGQLRKFKLTDTVREISGRLTAKELLTFFKRIESAGKISYSRNQFEAFSKAQPIPFVMRVSIVQKTSEYRTPDEQQQGKTPESKEPESSATAPTSSAPH